MIATIIAEEPNSPMFNAFCGSPPSLTDTMKVPSIDTIIPEAAIVRGKVIKFISKSPATRILAPNTIEPIIEPT